MRNFKPDQGARGGTLPPTRICEPFTRGALNTGAYVLVATSGFHNGSRPHSESIREAAFFVTRAGLSGEPDRHSRGAKQIVVVWLHDFEEETIVRGVLSPRRAAPALSTQRV
jgi:hypothetical protein